MMHVEHFIARVVNVKDDPEKSGRIQIRIYGLHDDTTRIPDKDLPWARCLYPVTNPVHQGMAGPTTGMVVNSTVMGFFADQDRQIPIISGALGAAGTSTINTDTSNTNTDSTDFPKADRGIDHNDVLQKSVVSIGKQKAKFGIEKSIGSVAYMGQEIGELLHQVQGGNFIAAVKIGLSVINQFQSLKNSVIGEFNHIVGEVRSVENLGQGIIGQVTNFQLSLGSINSEINSVMGAVSEANHIVNEATNFASMLSGAPGAIASGINSVDSLIQMVPGGHLINLGQSLEQWRLAQSLLGSITNTITEASQIFNTVNNVMGNIATRTSKNPISSVSDALSRINGYRFVMNGVMTNLETSLNMMQHMKSIL